MKKIIPFLLLLTACKTVETKKTNFISEPLTVIDRNDNPARKAKEITDKQPIKLADGLQIKLWASDSLVFDPVSIEVDAKGAVYFSRQRRGRNSEFDIRGHQTWMTKSISMNTVEDKRSFLRETFDPSKTKENSWLADLNFDGVHDWQDLKVEKDEIWKVTDTNGDGYADKSQRIVELPSEEITDCVGGFLIRKNDMFMAAGPDMSRLFDTNNDGVYDSKTIISTGYGVHIGFGGHNMSGVIEGPDGKIYWNIGDIGANITGVDGKKYNNSNSGGIFRSNADGSDFEIFATGLRNTHEFVFDQFGNMISEDNDGDHPTERERLVHIVEGMDAGWRSNWQYGKYTDPKNNKYKVWMDEKLSIPHWEGQAAHILPPIMNYHNGPTGMQFNPGTGLGKEHLNKFFIVEFVGAPTKSHIWSFGLKPKGASFELDGEKDIVSGILPTGIRFGADGALYAADWINGWNNKDFGRIWKIDVKDENNDLKEIRTKTQAILNENFEMMSDKNLSELLLNPDQRIRQNAQFELAKRDMNGFRVFQDILQNSDNNLAKLHAIWGIGMLSHKKPQYATPLLLCLNEKDPNVLCQTIKTIGELKMTLAKDKISGLLNHENDQVKFYAAETLGKIGNNSNISELVNFLKLNNDKDLYLRHAAVLALSRLKAEPEMAALSTNDSKALRTAAVLVLRKLQSPKISLFLKDADEYIVTEAARGIHDDLSIPESLPDLAEMLKTVTSKNEALVRRILSASQRVGRMEYLDMVLTYLKRDSISENLKNEAIAVIGTWAQPSVLDRVDGRFRGEVKRDLALIQAKVKPHIEDLFNTNNNALITSICALLQNLQIEEFNDKLTRLYEVQTDSKIKATLINTLSSLNFSSLDGLINSALEDPKSDIRGAGIAALPKISVSKERLNEIVTPIFKKGSISEKQKLINTLGNMPNTSTEDVFKSLAREKSEGKLENELWLELSEAIQKTGLQFLIDLVAIKNTAEDWMAEFKETLFGGNAREGRNTFEYNSAGQCARCHSLQEGVGSNVGPYLNKIGSKLSREQILEAMIKPSNAIAMGFGTVNFTLTDGTEISGILASENEKEVVITTSDAEPTRIGISRIVKRENYPSSMPAMGELLSKREIRDLVEFLSNQK